MEVRIYENQSYGDEVVVGGLVEQEEVAQSPLEIALDLDKKYGADIKCVLSGVELADHYNLVDSFYAVEINNFSNLRTISEQDSANAKDLLERIGYSWGGTNYNILRKVRIAANMFSREE